MNKINYLIVGDSFSAEEKAKTLQDKIRSEKKGQIAAVQYRLSETPLDQILAQARTLPFLTDFQIFRVRQAELIKEKNAELL